jgi:hypothetical protein
VTRLEQYPNQMADMDVWMTAAALLVATLFLLTAIGPTMRGA